MDAPAQRPGSDGSDGSSGSTGSSALPEASRLAETAWHALSADAALSHLGANADDGLAEEAVQRRRARYGANELPEAGRDSLAKVFLRQFRDPLIYVLLAAGAVSLGIGSYSDAGFVFAVLLLNAGLGTYQEYRAESAAQALQQVLEITARVWRNGRRREVPSTELVPGDLVELRAGASVPADLRLLEAGDLRLDESLLTGEAEPAEKGPADELAEDTPLGDRSTLAHAGTTVMGGHGRGLVVRTGLATEVGRIARSLAEKGQEPPLVVRMRRFTRAIAIAVLGIIVVLGGVQALRGAEPLDLFMLSVALAVSAIPAGLPVAITVALSIGSNRMAGRNVIVRQLPAVEGLGACTLIASDKTGTLTQNQLAVERVAPLEGTAIEVTGGGRALEGGFRRNGEELDPSRESWLAELLRTGVLCNDAELEREDDELAEAKGDTVDVALLVLAVKAGLTREGLGDEYRQLAEIPFESQNRYAASFDRHEGRAFAHVKGAAETLAEMCDVDAEAVRAAEQELADQGYRVLALACGEVDAQAAREADPRALKGLRFLGLVGMVDPVRENVPAALTQCREAGVEVRMITGDHPSTALAVGHELQITDTRDDILLGRELGESLKEGDEQEGGEQEARIQRAHIFARVEPAQKTVIVDALQQAGHFVAVTGDGVNDAPALRRANIGVAMGASGTDIARRAADLILTDDNFASIVNGIEEGRRAYDNVRKVVWLLVSTGLAELILFTLSVAFQTPLPLTPVQLLWLNLVTNGIQDIALAFEKGEPGVLKRQPRAPDERIFNRLMVEEVLVSGVYMGLVGFAVFYVLIEHFAMSAFAASNLLLLLLVLFENVHAFNVRSERISAFRVPLSNNWLLVGGVVLAQAVHIASMFVPGWRDLLDIEPVSLTAWLVLLAIAASKFISVELYKWLRGRRLAERIDRTPPMGGRLQGASA